MNKIGENQCKDILDSFGWDSTGYEESSGVRAREREDSHIFYFRDWFNIVTARGLRAGRCYKIYENSFAPKRDLFTEDGIVSLCAKDLTDPETGLRKDLHPKEKSEKQQKELQETQDELSM